MPKLKYHKEKTSKLYEYSKAEKVFKISNGKKYKVEVIRDSLVYN